MTAPNAEQIEAEAASWLERRLHAPWSKDDQAALETWLAASLAHRIAYLRLEDAWRCADRLAALRPAPRRSAAAQIWPALRKTAAGFAVAAIIGFSGYQLAKAPPADVYATAIGGHKIITFKDGTKVELNTDTVLRVSQNDGERKAWLDRGEAYFQVEHDAARPFIVIVDGRKVTDLGTKFTVRQDAGKLHVAVVEGLVEVEAKDQKPQSLLKPGDVLVATASAQTVTKKPMQAILASLDWQRGKLMFDNITLAEAVAEFNRYNTRKLVLADQKVAKLTIAGSFQAGNLDVFTNAVRDVFGLKLEKQQHQIILSK